MNAAENFTKADFTKALGLQCVSSPARDLEEEVTSKASMMDRLVLPQPRKVLLEALSPVSSEGKLSDSPSCPTTQKLSMSNTVIIFDWDDTLLCTSWLAKHMHQHPSDE